MPLDPSIFGQIQQPQQVNPLAQLAQASQIQGAQQQNRLAALQMQEYERARTEAEAARGIYSGFGSDVSANQQALFRGGLGKEALAYGKSAAEAQKAQLEQQAAQFKLAHDKSTALRNIIGGVKDQAGYTQGLSAAQALGLDVSNEPAIYNPAYVANLAQQALTQQQRLEAELKQRGFDVTMRGQDITRQNSIDTNATSRANNSASVGATIRGQNLTDSRAREFNGIQQQAARNQIVETPTGVMLVDKGTGQSQPVMSGGQPLVGKPDSGTQKELLSINQQRSILNGALDSVSKTPSAFSYGRGAAGKVSESVAGRFEKPEETQARAYVFNNVSRVINERAGAAQSAQELQRLNSFLPADTDNAEQIKNKLQGFNHYLDDLEAGTRGKPRTATPPSSGGWSVKEVR